MGASNATGIEWNDISINRSFPLADIMKTVNAINSIIEQAPLEDASPPHKKCSVVEPANINLRTNNILPANNHLCPGKKWSQR
jgi:hypothetical protein